MEKRKNKIKLIIFPGNFLPNTGGLESHVNELSKYLSKNKKYEITIFSPNTAKGKTKETIHNGIKVIRYPAFEIVPNFPFPNLFSLKFYKLLISIYKKDYDIVMTRTRFFSNTFLGTIFAKFRLNRKKLIHAEHGSEFVKVKNKITSLIAYIYDMLIARITFMLSDKLVAVSQASKNFVEREFTNKKVEVITRGVDFKEVHDKKDNETIKKFKGKVMICTICRLFEWKGIANVIDSYKSLPENIKKKCVYIVVGDGEDLEKLKQRAGKYNGNGIYFYGNKKREDAIKVLNTVDIFVHSSYPGGGLSNSLLEAMKTSKAIIASPYEGANEVINPRNGICLKDNKVKSIRNGMIKLVSDKKLRNKLGKNANKTIVEDFKWNDKIKQYDKLFKEVLNKK